MVKIKFYKIKTRFTALALAGTIFATGIGLTGCGSKSNETKDVTSYEESSEEVIEEESLESLVSNTSKELKNIISNDEISNNAAIVLLLNVIAKKDENGKISADEISKLKSKLNVDNMMGDFNSFLDTLESKTTKENILYRVSELLPEALENDKKILLNIELILDNIIKYSNEGNKEQLLLEFNKIYSLFAEGKKITVNGLEFEIYDLSYSSRAVANRYAQIATYYSRNYINNDQYSKMDKVVNDQNNKVEIKTILEILSNQMIEQSEVDVIYLFDNKYESVTNLLNGKVNLSQDTVKNLTNYLNIEYLDSDKVSTKDKNNILGEYDDSKVNDVLLAIDTISEYNLNHQDNIIPLSLFFVDEYLKTDTGKTDAIALNFIQFNTIMLVNTKDKITSYESLRNNPYFENIFKYFTKDNFTHLQKDENGVVIENNVVWQEISLGTNFANDEIILYVLNKLPKLEVIDNYNEKSEMNLIETIKGIQKVSMGECKTTDFNQFVKRK